MPMNQTEQAEFNRLHEQVVMLEAQREAQIAETAATIETRVREATE